MQETNLELKVRELFKECYQKLRIAMLNAIVAHTDHFGKEAIHETIEHLFSLFPCLVSFDTIDNYDELDSEIEDLDEKLYSLMYIEVKQFINYVVKEI